MTAAGSGAGRLGGRADAGQAAGQGRGGHGVLVGLAEDELDAISRGEEDWVPLLKRFWQPFIDQVKDKETSVTRAEAAQARELGTDPESGRVMSVRMGRFGPFVQIGRREDEEKPRFAGLRPGQNIDTITREEALELFKLPRVLGKTPDGEEVSANIGRYGPYVRYGRKFVSLGDDDPFTVTLDRALELIEATGKTGSELYRQAGSRDDFDVLRIVLTMVRDRGGELRLMQAHPGTVATIELPAR